MTYKMKDIKPDSVFQALSRMRLLMLKARQGLKPTVRLNTGDVETIFHYALKKYNLENLKPDCKEFENAFIALALKIGEDNPTYANMTSDEKKAYRIELITEGKILDFWMGMASNEQIDSKTMRVAIARAIGGFLHMIHLADEEKVIFDLKTLSALAEHESVEFGKTIIGWEKLFKKA
ncbi:MAG: hypothetical protein V4721_00615 [Bacteroidota bacterium]